ncbi:MAG TPA: SRPBCC domain-containing protein [Planctomycetota bacterium]
MKPPATDTPALTDATVREKTGKTLSQWFEHLDGLGGLAKGRRELVNAIYGADKLDEWWATTVVVEYERARGAKEKDGQPKGYSICSTKTIAVPLERVFQAFGKAEDLDRWLGPKTKIEFGDGGTLANADGDRASFTRIRPGKDLRLAWQHATRAPGSQVEVLFAAKGAGKTGLTLNHTRIQARRDADELRAGWSAAFERLKAHLEGA